MEITKTRRASEELLPRKVHGMQIGVTVPGGSHPQHHHVLPTATGVRIGSRSGNDIVVDDPMVSRSHCEIVPQDGDFILRDLGSKNGTQVNGVRIKEVYLPQVARVLLGESVVEIHVSSDTSPVPTLSASHLVGLVGDSAAIREVYSLLSQVAPSDITVLIEGETGTGKELAAQALHHLSGRRGGPFVVFDCSATPRHLVESQLFGHERGAFTGAVKRTAGRLEEADGGTLFIDELGELPLDLQPKLLRALESRRFRRVGGSTDIQVDIRVVSATNRSLARQVNQGTFREDLYFRLAVLRIALPSLRERRQDIPALVSHFIQQAMPDDALGAQGMIRSIDASLWSQLQAYHWPGNVRELRNFVERTLALGASSPDILAQLRETSRASKFPDSRGEPGFDETTGELCFPISVEAGFAAQKTALLECFAKRYLSEQLLRHEGNISRAAEASELDRMYFKRLVKKYCP